MRWSLKIATFFGIGVYLHWTFLLVLAWLVVVMIGQGAAAEAEGQSLSTADSMRIVGLVISVFVCVLLHEFGHALTARRFGVKTKDITLLPIGGMARMDSIPKQPHIEFWIAIAGPLVNVAIAVLIVAAIGIRDGGLPWPIDAEAWESDFLLQLLTVNAVLVLFNLLPAFPMDGGRVLRALLAGRYEYDAATRMAAGVGQFMAILFAVVGLLMGHFMLLFIALFVFIGAQQEAQGSMIRHMLADVGVSRGMLRRFQTLEEHEPLSSAIDELLAGAQQDFPIVDREGRLRGLLTRQTLLTAISSAESGEQTVGEVMETEVMTVRLHDPLGDVLEKLQQEERRSAPVIDNDRVVGLLTTDNVMELLMVRQAQKRRS